MVLVRFVYTDQRSVKLRPALVVSSDVYHQGRREVILAGITSNVRRVLVCDTPVKKWQAAGLLAPSVVAGIIQTARQSDLSRRLGTMSPADLQGVEGNLRTALGFA
ncbi:MAG: type II toxin-antitoxin system PemK/MazF family toxin [Chloroflexi bacterium]|nr:type II toxin-antitoxin system PemK/MazF family toxin [Chloroflexota bacterium]